MTQGSSQDIDRLRGEINRRLAALLPACLEGQETLEQAIRSSVMAPGKRLRPMISALTAMDLGGNVEAAIDGGCAIELVHTASLILDDLPCMDDAALRRGDPALHVAYGQDVALLSVIAMLSRAFEVLSQIPSLTPEQRTRCVAALTRAVGSGGLVGGQYADLRAGRGERSEDDVARVNALKTGSLFLAAVEIGAVGSGATTAVREELAGFARELGLAFQLLDDLLDGGTSATDIGKDVGKDAGKSTIVSMIGRESTEQQIDRNLRAAAKHLDAGLGTGSRLKQLMIMIRDGARKHVSGETAGQPATPRLDDQAGMQ